MAEPIPDTWQEALTRRLRTLLRIVPLQRVEAAKGRRELELDDQDLRALSLRALDLTIERMGLGSGPTIEELLDGLRPLARSCDDGATDEEIDAVTRLVVDELLNERDRRRAFSESYLAIERDRVVRRHLTFHLLQEHAAPDGSIVVKATTEAINLYAGMLEYPVEDAQIAEEAVLRSQVSRGRIADAVQTARRARLRSIEYEQKVTSYLETTRRDVTQLDWVSDVLSLVRDARGHIEDRVTTESDLIRAVDQRLEGALGETGAQLATLRDVLGECLARHLRLQERIIVANQEYLDEHDRQAFRPRAIAPLPDLEADVLRWALACTTGYLADHVDRLLAWFQGPTARPVLHLSSLVDRLLAPRREDEDEPVDLEDTELERFDATPPRFTDDDHRIVDELLADLRGEQHLSEVLAHARQRSMSEARQRLLVLRVLLGFDPQAQSGPDLQIEPRGRALADVMFTGDDLVLRSMR